MVLATQNVRGKRAKTENIPGDWCFIVCCVLVNAPEDSYKLRKVKAADGQKL
jgi:hypothetical protein